MKDKKAKGAKTCVIKRKLKFQHYKNCLEAADLEINHLERNKIGVDSLKEDQNKFIKNKKLIIRSQQRFKSERHVFTEEINKFALSSNDDKRIQSMDSIGTYTYRKSKDLVSKKEETKCNNIIKQYKNWLTLMLSQKKT